MGEWKEYKLGEVYSFSSGLSKSSDQFGYGFDFLTFKDVFNNYFLPKKLTALVNSTEKERQTCSIKRGDVFLTRTSETDDELGMSSVALKDYPNATFNGFTKRLRPLGNVEIYPEFVAYYFRSPRFRANIVGMSSITTRASLNNSMLAELPLLLPNYEEQIRIATILKSLDDKIDLLHRENATLEAMAETLFRQWFIEEAKEDWKEVPLEYVCERITDGSHYSPESVEIGLPMASVKDMEDWGFNLKSCRKISREEYEKLIASDCLPQVNDILIAKDGSYLKHIFVVDKIQEVVVLSSIAIIRPNGLYHPYLLSIFLKLDTTKEELKNIVTGAVIPRIVLKDFRKFLIQLPPIEKQDEALNILKPIIEKCFRNRDEIQNLIQIRDSLLPKLMNRDISIYG